MNLRNFEIVAYRFSDYSIKIERSKIATMPFKILRSAFDAAREIEHDKELDKIVLRNTDFIPQLETREDEAHPEARTCVLVEKLDDSPKKHQTPASGAPV